MANQMIAIQTRNPQLPDPSRAAARYANLINMASQQRASQLQAERTRQEMDYARASEGRAAQTQTAAMRKSDQDYQIADMTRLRNIGLSVLKSGNEEAYQDLLGLIKESDPQFGAIISKVAPTLAANPNALRYVIDEASDYLSKNTSQRTSTAEFDAQGNLVLMDLGGDEPPRIRSGVATEDPYIPPTKTTAAAPQQTPVATVGAGAPMRATRGANTTPRALMQQGMDPRNIPSGMPTVRPISFNQSDMATPTAGQMSPDMVPDILDSAINTGVMAQIDLDQIIALAPPQARQGIMDVIRSNNIALQADAPSLAASGMGQQPPMAVNPVQRPDSTYANLPPRQLQDSQPMMQNTLAQYRVGEQIKGKNPSMSPYPGSAQVPLSRVAAEAAVQRETPEQAAARAAATARATATVETEKKAAEKLPGRNQVSSLVKKIRNAYETLEKQEAIVSEKRGGIANAMDYFGTTSLGREAQKMVGTRSSKYLSEIVNSRKLLATAIKNATGMSAQEMNSNTELQLMLDALTDPTQGIEAARSTLGAIEELYGAPRTAAPAAAASRAAAKTPTIPDAAKQMLRKNPSPQQRAFFDRTFGKGAAAKVMGNR